MKDKRGQTIIDYSFGVGIFLIVVLFVFITIPSLFAPFESQQEDIQTAERVETSLATNWLLHEQNPEPYVLNEECTVYLFANSDGSTDQLDTDCRYAGPTETAQFSDIVPVETTVPGDILRLNITMEKRPYTGQPATLTEEPNENYPYIDDRTASVGKYKLAYGPIPPDRNTITVSYRQVYMDGKQYRLYIRVW